MIRLICEKTVSDRNNERDLKASIRELVTALEGSLEEHPAPEELQDFVVGDLPEPERQRIEEHLALCRECARKALDLAESPEPVRRGALVTERELEVQWERFRVNVAPVTRARQSRKFLPLAAVLLAGIIGLTAWGARELQDLRGLPYVAYVATTRGSLDQEAIRLPSWAGRLELMLSLETPTYPEYGVEMVAADGRQVWSKRGIPRQDDDTVVVSVPVRLLSKGTYKIRLSGPQGQTVAENKVRIEPAPGK